MNFYQFEPKDFDHVKDVMDNLIEDILITYECIL